MTKQKKQEDTYSYKGWLNSDKLIKRALAVYGHAFIGGLMIVLPIYFIIFVIYLIAYFATK